MSSLLHRVIAVTRLAGREPTQTGRVLVYGSRSPSEQSASVALDAHSANGKGPRSVWTGPKVSATRGGAPMLRRARSA